MTKQTPFHSARAARRAAAAKGPPPDPEVDALLGFKAVYRATKRYDGWSPEIQRDFIAALAELGHVRDAAQSLGRTESGAYKVRGSDGAESFADAWDAALALYHRRNPVAPAIGRPSRGRAKAEAAAAPPPASSAEDMDPTLELRREKFDSIMRKYMVKLDQEREARLAGRIVEADFIVRQLTVIEVILDLGKGGLDLIRRLRIGDVDATGIVATPVSLLLDAARRAYWTERGEPERPPLPELGVHDERRALGRDRSWMPSRDGTREEWEERNQEQWSQAAEAQRLWEEKARAEAAAWRERTGGAASAAGGNSPDADNDDEGEDDAF